MNVECDGKALGEEKGEVGLYNFEIGRKGIRERGYVPSVCCIIKEAGEVGKPN